MKTRVRHLLLLLAAATVVAKSHPLFAEVRRPFTVKDSIAMTTFSDPDEHLPDVACKRSPDGKYFLVITTKGLLARNQIMSSLSVFSEDEIRKYLRGNAITPPARHQLLNIIGTPIAPQDNSYGSLITKVQWSSDSLSILSLVERADGHRHLFRTYLHGKGSVDLTPGDVNVRNFSEGGGTIAYTVAEHMAPPYLVGHPIDKVSSDLTGVSLFHVFFPDTYPDPDSFFPAVDLWVRRKGVNTKVNNSSWYFPISAASLQLGVSPDGKGLIAARPVPNIPSRWYRYKIPDSGSSFATTHTGTDRSGRNFNWPWQYIYIDLDTMNIRPLVNAPSGFLEGYMDISEAVWSPNNQTALFTNSYLPLAAASVDKDEREPACAAAVYQLHTQQTRCIAYARFPEVKEFLRSAVFGVSSNEVILKWFGEGREDVERYVKDRQGVWLRQADEASSKKLQQPPIRISLRQDINQPPVLWAHDEDTDVWKELWDPNPQLKSIQLGKASVYTWKDNTGYQWHGGLVLPPNFIEGRRYPLLIQTHGFYNEHEFLVDGSFTTGFAARALASAGIIVLQMEDRADRHVQPQDEEASLTVEGFESAIDHLDRDGLIDPTRVGVIGFSRTAWYVEEALIHAPRLFRAATLIDGIDQSYMSYMLFAPGWPEAAEEEEAANGGKPFGPELQSWIKNAADFNLDKVRAPVRVEAIGLESVLGEWEIYSSLYQQGKPVDLVYIPDGQHILQKPQERYASQQGNVDWFRFWLEGYRDPNPAKRKEYERWAQWKSPNSTSPVN